MSPGAICSYIIYLLNQFVIIQVHHLMPYICCLGNFGVIILTPFFNKLRYCMISK